MKKILSTTALAALLAISANSAYAQMPPPPCDCGCPKCKNAQHQMMSPQDRQQKIAEFEKRLKLTDEQKEAIEKNRKASKKKLEALKQKERKLHEEKRAILEQNKKDFESILTSEQKEELKKIEEERAEKMKEYFKNRPQPKKD